MVQQEIDLKNSKFWNDLCGSGLALSLGITEINAETLAQFDQAYMAFYPYLAGYISREMLQGQKVLEIGLGYGTLGQALISHAARYCGIDIAPGPVAMMSDRLNLMGKKEQGQVKLGSALEIPYPDENFDHVYSIGCLHHTGDLERSIDEVYRVLKPRGRAVIMLYHRHSFRQLVQVPYRWVKNLFKSGRKNFSELVRSMYDTDLSGETAPHTDYISLSQARSLFRQFSEVAIDIQNFETYPLFGGLIKIKREWFLNNVARVLGLDLYIVATK